VNASVSASTTQGSADLQPGIAGFPGRSCRRDCARYTSGSR
jgi:hypothetical protein